MLNRNFIYGLVLSVAMAAVAHADETRIAYINTQRITSESELAKAATARLEQEFSKRQKDLADMQQSLKTKGESLERDALTMNDTQRQTRQREVTDMGREFQRKQREYQEDLNSRKTEELQRVLDAANKAVKQVAETDKYDLVIQDGIVYNNGKHDITDKVLKLLKTTGK